ncbi:uncharacterized protein LOC132035031 [Lycium ferocissimum]|uniref:uncharacterized protein LOC132035031 n=1 Tax=Lycium ferocissimum TaxID=112874 RepID=UPI00281678B1|nr:uncharacterized protein LOC132035031 [Lycium ferocissimum]
MEAEEKKGGVPFRLSTCLDFINCMDDCGMTESSFVGNVHTLCGGERGGIIKIRLDDVLMHNKEWASKFPNVTVEHLSKTGSDHNLLLVRCSDDQQHVIKYLKFLNFWTDQEDYLSLVNLGN